jgi:hypothetical protein
MDPYIKETIIIGLRKPILKEKAMNPKKRNRKRKEHNTESWKVQEPSGLSSSVNMVSQPIRWHRTLTTSCCGFSILCFSVCASGLWRLLSFFEDFSKTPSKIWRVYSIRILKDI